MLFSKQLPLQSLILLCRVLRHNLGAGLTLRDVFRQQAKRGPYDVRPIAGRISENVEKGESLVDALQEEKAYFPPLFLSIAGVGERSGQLPEVFAELEKYYLMQQKLWRLFIRQSWQPALQFFLAVLVIALLMLILGAIDSKIDPVGLGNGPAASVKFLAIVFGTLALLTAVYLIVTRTMRQKAKVDLILLRVPAIGPCFEALALSRFCVAAHLTMETGMSISKALRLCMKATGNAGYASRADVLVEGVKAGDDLTKAMTRTKIFPRNFLDIVATAEEGGRVPEVMIHQAQFYEEEAGRRLTVLTNVVSAIIWLLTASFIIVLIFRLYSQVYGAGSQLQQLLN